MAVIWADFPSGQQGLYQDYANMLNGVWAEVQSASSTYDCIVDDPDPTIGSAGQVLWANCATTASNQNSKRARMALPAEVTTLGLSFRWWLSKLPTDTNNYPWVSMRDNTNTEIARIDVSTTGQIRVMSGGNTHGANGTTQGTTSGPVLLANAWQHVEFKLTKGAGTGAAVVRVNGVTVLNLSGLTLSANNIAQFVLGCLEESGGGDGAMNSYWKDLVVWDTTGTHITDFPGAVFVYDLVPDGDNTVGWSSTGANGWSTIDENTANDADYVYADATPPSPSIFTMTDLPEDTVSVRAVLSVGRMVKTDGGDCNVEIALSPNGVDWDPGADRPITVASTYWWDVSHTSPDTSAAWTVDEVNDILFRVDRTL